MAPEHLQELDEIIAKAIPFSATDCHKEKEKKRWRREKAKERLIEFYDRIRTI